MPRQQEMTQKCQMTSVLCPTMGGNYSQNKPAGRSDQLQIILFRFTKQRLIWGSDTNFPEANQHVFFSLFTIKYQGDVSLESETLMFPLHTSCITGLWVLAQCLLAASL